MDFQIPKIVHEVLDPVFLRLRSGEPRIIDADSGGFNCRRYALEQATVVGPSEGK